MRLLTNGCTRNVLLVGRWAVKVPTCRTWGLFLYGLLSNMQEAAYSRTGHPELCPVVFSLPGGLLLVMRRARPLTLVEWCALDLKAFLDGGAFVLSQLVEPKRCSFGVLDGRIVALDYGACGPDLRVEMDVGQAVATRA